MATTAGAKKGLWSTIRRIAASDRISGLIMLGFALTGLVLANLPATAHAFETVAETHLFIPYTNLDLPIGHWAQDGLLTIFFLTVGLELKQELTTGSLANPKAAAVPMLCAVGGMIAPPILFLAVLPSRATSPRTGCCCRWWSESACRVHQARSERTMP